MKLRQFINELTEAYEKSGVYLDNLEVKIVLDMQSIGARRTTGIKKC